MREIVTPAIILSTKSFANEDKQIKVFSRDLGKLSAKAVSGAKIKSKLSPHLDTLNFSMIRLVRKHRFTITDALTKDRFNSIRKNPSKMKRALKISHLLEFLLPKLTAARKCWDQFFKSLKTESLEAGKFLKILGYDPLLASCFRCKNKEIKNFLPDDQVFFCKNCSENFPQERLIKI